MTQGGVYQITCRANGRIYIGSSQSIRSRFREHRDDLKNGRHRSRHLQRAWDKYGPDFFAFDVLEWIGDRDRRLAAEQRWLDERLPFGDRGFNSCRVAGSTQGTRHSMESREKISASLRGRQHTEDTKEKQRATKIGPLNPQYGRPLTDRQRAVLCRAGESHSWFGRKHAESTKAKIASAKARPVRQLASDGTLIATWPQPSAVARALGLKGCETIHRSCRDPGRMAAGFRWEYVRE